MSSVQKENESIKKYFEEYYSGFSVFSPKNRKKGWSLLYNDYLYRESVHRAVYRGLLQTLEGTSLNLLNILDVGCGDGNLLRTFIEWGANPKNLYGVDASKTIIQEAKRLSSIEINFQHAMGSELPFEKHFFDIVTSFGVIIHVMDDDTIRAISKKIKEIIKPTGHFFLLFTNENGKYPPDSMKDHVRVFNRNHHEIEKLFLEWEIISKEESIIETWKDFAELLVEKGKKPEVMEWFRNFPSTKDILLEGNLDFLIAKLCRTYQCGTSSIYIMTPKEEAV